MSKYRPMADWEVVAEWRALERGEFHSATVLLYGHALATVRDRDAKIAALEAESDRILKEAAEAGWDYSVANNALAAKIAKLRAALSEYGPREHNCDDDCGLGESCLLAFKDPREGAVCNCGAAEHNAAIDRALKETA